METNEFDNLPYITSQERLHSILLQPDLLRQIDHEVELQANEAFVDLGLAKVAIQIDTAELIREELLETLKQFPRLDPDILPEFGRGPNYIEAGSIIGSQRTAFLLFATGEVLGFWQVVTPRKLFGNIINDSLNREMIGRGYVTIEQTYDGLIV